MKKLLLFILLSATLFSCMIHLVPAKSPIALVSTQNIQKDIGSLYDRIMVSSDKTWNTYALDYTAIDVEIDSLISYDKTRSNVSNIVHQVILLQSAFTEYEGEHKAKGRIATSEAKVYKSYLNSFIKPILISENSLK